MSKPIDKKPIHISGQIIDIESIAKQMTEASKKFYQDQTAERNIQKCIQHRDFLLKLLKEIETAFMGEKSKRVMEVSGILFGGVEYFNEKITQLARYH
jgi:ribosomal protein S15P/S13E